MTPSASRRKTWRAREEIAQPRASFEELEIHGSDGAVLRALVDDPDAKDPIRATLVLAHAMFARKTSFGKRDRPGLSSALTKHGFRTVAFDFRGHGDSKPPTQEKEQEDWGYDDLVTRDLPAVVECARARGEDKPVIVVGHSLGGHVALASQGTDCIHADAVVLLAANVWLRAFEPSRLRWAVKSAVAHATLAVSSRTNGVPARKLRLGSDDSSRRYTDDLFGFVAKDEWRSRDGRVDYLAALSKVDVPVAAVVGDRDRIMCHPRAGEAFARRCKGPVAIFHAPHATHMGIVTSPEAQSTVIEAVEWALSRVEGSTPCRPPSR